MKKNAFTLVELMAVITILAVILLISLPALFGTLKNSNEKKYQDFLDNLYMATEHYIMGEIDKNPELQNSTEPIIVTIYDLRQMDYIHTNPINPKTDKVVSDFATVTAYREANNTYRYEFKEENK